MAQCKMCGKSGWLLSVSNEGLCGTCYAVYINDIRQHPRVIQDCINLVADSKKLDTRLSRCDLLVERARVLLQYEEIGIETIKPSPSELISNYTSARNEIIIETVKANVEKCLGKAEVAATARTAVTQANNALFKITEAREDFGNYPEFDKLEERVKCFSHETQLNEFIEKAKKAEFKGNKKKALDQYQEALYFLKTDEIDDSMQDEHIQEIEAKIKELSE